MLVTALSGIVIALSFSAPPGPVALETIRRGLRGGFRPALHVQLGSIFGDVTWCAVALVGLAPLAEVTWVRAALAVAGVGVLAYLGLSGLRDALAARATLAASTLGDPVPAAGAFRSGLAISLANPVAVGYWLGVGGALVAAGVAGSSAAQTGAFLVGYVAGTLAWALLMAAAIRWGRALLTPRVFRWVTVASSVALLAFGVSLAVRSFA